MTPLSPATTQPPTALQQHAKPASSQARKHVVLDRAVPFGLYAWLENNEILPSAQQFPTSGAKQMTRRPRPFTIRHFVWLLIFTFVAGLVSVWTKSAHAQTLSQPVSIERTAAQNACVGTGFGLQTLVQLVLNGTNVATAPLPCGQAVRWADAIKTAGTYQIAFRSGNSAGLAAPSPPVSQQVGESVIPPPLPGTLFTLTCGTPPGPCQPPIVLVPTSP